MRFGVTGSLCYLICTLSKSYRIEMSCLSHPWQVLRTDVQIHYAPNAIVNLIFSLYSDIGAISADFGSANFTSHRFLQTMRKSERIGYSPSLRLTDIGPGRFAIRPHLYRYEGFAAKILFIDCREPNFSHPQTTVIPPIDRSIVANQQ